MVKSVSGGGTPRRRGDLWGDHDLGSDEVSKDPFVSVPFTGARSLFKVSSKVVRSNGWIKFLSDGICDTVRRFYDILYESHQLKHLCPSCCHQRPPPPLPSYVLINYTYYKVNMSYLSRPLTRVFLHLHELW